MSLLVIASMAAQLVPTIAILERLPPRAAGDLVLAGRDHQPIETVMRTPMVGLWLPGEAELEMVEKARLASTECVRRRWRVIFYNVSSDPSSQTPRSVYPIEEFAVPKRRSCPREGYVSLSHVTPVQASAAVRRLDAIRSRAAKVELSCSDTTASGLCDSRQTIMKGLSTISPWLVRRENGATMIWLGKPGSTVTEVRWREDAPEQVSVDRRVPAPF